MHVPRVGQIKLLAAPQSIARFGAIYLDGRIF
jgi:hypothetical protein